MMVLVFRLFYLPPALHWVLLLGLFIHIFSIHVLAYFSLALIILLALAVKQV